MLRARSRSNQGPTFYSGASLRECAAFERCILFLFKSFFLQEAFIMSSQASFTFQIFLCKLYCIYEDVWSQNLDSGSVFCVRFLIWIDYFPAPKTNARLNLYPFLTYAASISCLLVMGPAGGDASFVVQWIHTYRIYGCIPHVLVLMNECLNGFGGIDGTNLLRKQQKDVKGWQLIALPLLLRVYSCTVAVL